jgi:excisionase family DNA binding protein
MDVRQNDQGPLRLYLTPREAAEALGICEKTLWTYTQKGDIPSIRIGKSVRYPVDGLRKLAQRPSEESA